MPVMTDAVAYADFLSRRRTELFGRIADACARAGRDATEVSLVAVSKTVDVDAVALAWQAGYRAFGENRPQELRRKAVGIAGRPEMAGVELHMIGNLQKNKINQVLESGVALVHSLSSVELARGVSSRAEARGLRVAGLLEVNVSGEASKAGMSPDEARAVAEEVAALPGIELVGLMAMAPAGDLDAARRSFSGLRELRDELAGRLGCPLPQLSCGMSGDFEVAVEEGSTIVRLGRVVFDPAYGFA